MTQTSLHTAYIIGNGDFTDIACLDCARKFAEDNNLVWNTSSEDNFTESDIAYASAIVFSIGESDSPYSCCDTYLETDFTREGEEDLKDNFPAWVVALYGY